jgi:hypothetical protein
MKNSLRPDLTVDEYAEVCNKLRVYRLEDAEFDDEDLPWQVDGIDTTTQAVSDWAYNFGTFKGAVFALPFIAKKHGVSFG